MNHLRRCFRGASWATKRHTLLTLLSPLLCFCATSRKVRRLRWSRELLEGSSKRGSLDAHRYQTVECFQIAFWPRSNDDLSRRVPTWTTNFSTRYADLRICGHSTSEPQRPAGATAIRCLAPGADGTIDVVYWYLLQAQSASTYHAIRSQSTVQRQKNSREQPF